MKHDHSCFAAPRAAAAYGSAIAERIARFVPMVRRQAWHIHGGGRPGIELDDLMQAGMVALTEAAQRHAGPTEDGFAAYAKLRVRGAMVDLIRRHVPLSRSQSRHDRPVRIESIDEAYSDTDFAFADERPDSFAILVEEELRGHLAGAIAALPERLQLVIQLYFVEELNLAEIAAALQVSVPRVHQIKAQALDRLRAALGDQATII
ncbi:MAG: sigma-70 family RNA polymerase sigma factor [Sphingomonadales bacterium]|nr:sigma-70 family RNA polymerase sigma factor [Sphingomonadales bacterium]